MTVNQIAAASAAAYQPQAQKPPVPQRGNSGPSPGPATNVTFSAQALAAYKNDMASGDGDHDGH